MTTKERLREMLAQCTGAPGAPARIDVMQSAEWLALQATVAAPALTYTLLVCGCGASVTMLAGSTPECAGCHTARIAREARTIRQAYDEKLMAVPDDCPPDREDRS